MNNPDLTGYHANGEVLGYARQSDEYGWLYQFAWMSVPMACETKERAISILKDAGCVKIVDEDGREVEE